MRRAGRTVRVHVSEPHDIRITRPGLWGNPFRAQDARAFNVRQHKRWIATQPYLLERVHELHGLRIACVCGPKQACHGDFLCVLADLL